MKPLISLLIGFLGEVGSKRLSFLLLWQTQGRLHAGCVMSPSLLPPVFKIIVYYPDAMLSAFFHISLKTN